MPQPDLVFGPVRDSLVQRRYTSAMIKLTSLSNNYSKDLNFLFLLAQTQRALTDFHGLIKTLTVITDLTKSPADYIELMLVLYAEGRLNEALDVALLLQEMELSAVESSVLNRCLVKIYLEFNDYEGVQEVITNHDGADRDDLMVWAMGLVHLTAAKQNEALDCFRKSVELNRMNDSAWVSLSLLHAEMGDRELALANLKKALDANPNNMTALKLMTKWTVAA